LLKGISYPGMAQVELRPGHLNRPVDLRKMGASDPPRCRFFGCHDCRGGRFVDPCPLFRRQSVLRTGGAGGLILRGPGSLGIQSADHRVSLAPVPQGPICGHQLRLGNRPFLRHRDTANRDRMASCGPDQRSLVIEIFRQASGYRCKEKHFRLRHPTSFST